MKKLALACGVALMLSPLTGWSQFNLASLGGSAFQMLGGTKGVASMADKFVNTSLQDPRLAGFLKGKKVDPATVGKVSNQLCAMLGGDCKAPLTDSQVAAAAKKLSPAQSQAISDNFNSALGKVASDPMVSELVTKAVGNKIPGVLAGLL